MSCLGWINPSREETIEFMRYQLSDMSTEMYKRKHKKVHYGVMELDDLLDFLYGPGKSETTLRGSKV